MADGLQGSVLTESTLENPDLLGVMLATALDCIIVMDEAGLIREFNPAAERTFRYRREDVLDRLLADVIIPPHYRDAHAKGLARFVAGGASRMLGRRIEIEAMRHDGTIFPVELTITALAAAEGRLFLAYLRDITEQRASEEALRASEARFRGLVDDQTELVYRYDAQNRLMFANSAACRLHGKPLEELLGQEMQLTIPDHVWVPLEQTLRSLTPENPLHQQENAKQMPNGDDAWFSFSNRALFDDHGNCTGYLAVGHDITQQRMTALELQRQREALQQSEKLAALGSLLAGVAHELNNPLAVVIARAFMLEEEVTDPAIRSSVVPLRIAAERCARIVQTFLAVARQKPRARQPLAVEPQLAAVLEMLAYGLRSGGIEVIRDWRAGADATVDADEDALHQVFLNLVINAQQALQDVQTKRRLFVNTRRRKHWLEVAIGDSGPGVPKAIQSRIFEPFFTTKPPGAGTGIGLAVCHGIVTAHGGTIELRDRAGGGARFVVRLPLTEAASTEVPQRSTEDDAGLAGRKVLIVDDEPEILDALAAIFRREGCIVLTAKDGRSGMNVLNGNKVDLVITDLRMPRYDGKSLLDALASMPAERRPAAIVLTGDTLNRRLLETSLDPPPTVLEKPVDPTVIRAIARQLLNRTR